MITISSIAIELLAYWLGGGKAADLGQMLGVTREHAQRKILGDYKAKHPQLLITTPSKGFRFRPKTDEYDLRYAPHTTAGFLGLLQGLAVQAESQEAPWLLDNYFTTTSLIIDTGIKVEQIQRLMAACFHRRSIDIDYVSKRKLSRIRFSPHTLVSCALRPHFRGFARTENQKGYIDIVPSRVRAVNDTNRKDYVGMDNDIEWHSFVNLTFRINHEIPGKIQDSIIEENGGSDTIHIHRARRALEMYIRRELEWRFVRNKVVKAWNLIESSPQAT